MVEPELRAQFPASVTCRGSRLSIRSSHGRLPYPQGYLIDLIGRFYAPAALGNQFGLELFDHGRTAAATSHNARRGTEWAFPAIVTGGQQGHSFSDCGVRVKKADPDHLRPVDARGRVKPGASLPLAARFEATLDKLEAALRIAAPVKKIHGARKALKEYRALLRLIETDEVRTARRAAAAVARTLSGDRDRQAARDAVAVLRAHKALGHEDADALLQFLPTDPPADAPEGDLFSPVRAWLRQARAAHADHVDRQAGEADLLRGLAKAYDKARAGGFSSPEAMHELRKRVITHRYQMSFFADIAGGKGARRARRAQDLRDLLGSIQDLETLRVQIAAVPSVPDEMRARLEAAIKDTQDSLSSSARRLQRGLFRRGRKAFWGRLGRQLADAGAGAGSPDGVPGAADHA
ncbi:MAG: hypothetical protein B7Z45_07205 [Azorhizobium sp. 12-66-6]|nr:MAG: hypothetical protein B7Z45_07205 [Azorhizobium sp. 12-66-6]